MSSNNLAPVAYTIPTGTHGRYLVRRARSDSPAGLLVGFHGYAQTAESFASELDAIREAEAWVAVSVQGLHRFYTRSRRIVASWMTSQDRDLAIGDNLSYVRRVVAEIKRTQLAGASDSDRLPLVFAGFSQGTAMAYRAAADSGACAGIIALGGDLPPELRTSSVRLPPVLLGRGHDDTRYPPETLARDITCLQGAAVELTVCEFEGGHEWTDAFRTAVATFLDSLKVRTLGR